jgi:hypothetical protein
LRSKGPIGIIRFMNLNPIWGLLSSVLLLHESLGATLAGVWGASLATRPALQKTPATS